MKTLSKGFVLGLAVWGLAGLGAYESVFEGKDAFTKKPCELRVIKTYYSGNTGKWADFRAEVTSGYRHGKVTPDDLVLKADGDSLLLGGDPDKAEIRVTLKKDSADLKAATAFRLKWNHGSHAHNHVCNALALKPSP